MKKVLFPFFALLLIAACEKEQVATTENHDQNTSALDRTANQVTICYRLGNGQYNVIQVNQNAVPAHLAHGDKLVDADGDGYTAPDCCTGSMDDCNDNNAGVNPGAAEVCDNGIDDDCDGLTDGDDSDCGCPYPFFTVESLNNQAPFFAYYDSEVAQCDFYFGTVEGGVWIFFEDNFSPAALAIEFEVEEGEVVKLVASLTEGEECVAVVGEQITEEEYEDALATLRAAIAANPPAFNICDDFLQNPGGDDARVKQKAAFEKFKNTLPAEMRKKLENK